MTLRIDELTFRYKTGLPEIFSHLSYEFPAGKLTALTGPSGCGKSTLLYVLGLMLSPTAGRVSYNDKSLSELDDCQRSAFRAREIGFIFQDSELDAFRPILESVIEPGLYAGLKATKLRRIGLQLLTHVGLGDQAEQKPTHISGGQGQRAAVARALINDPAIILADEPTGNLDRDNAAIVLDLLQTAASEGRTVVVATHDPFVKDACDCVIDIAEERDG
ncbi:MAG: ABC transporter ATP-binding protein [Bowdeniella nasicola]|nr:ABC transporter ATP-binding protein [Bowdeniella nasicola]